MLLTMANVVDGSAWVTTSVEGSTAAGVSAASVVVTVVK